MQAQNKNDSSPLITTYMERSLHASMKKLFCPDETCHEKRIGRYVADAFDGKTIFEIQTGSFSLLRKKIQYYIENTELDVVIVHPLAQNRKIIWLDKDSGDVALKPRLSAKHESLVSSLPQIFYLKEFLGHPRLSFCFPMLEVSEVRILDGYGKDRKKRSTSLDKIAGELFSVHYINSADDIKSIVAPLLPKEPFSRPQLSKALKLNGRKLWAAQNLLASIGLLSLHTQGRKFVFELKS